jgi:hypothetical protein
VSDDLDSLTREAHLFLDCSLFVTLSAEGFSDFFARVLANTGLFVGAIATLWF